MTFFLTEVSDQDWHLASRSPIINRSAHLRTTRLRHVESPRSRNFKIWNLENESAGATALGAASRSLETTGMDGPNDPDDDRGSDNDPFDWDEPSTLVEFMEGR